ncbi:MAG: RidA family protein [Actinomycetes bacterium]|jgi:enamine deaminase RidA (YjgF/YER057c/UK114 family)|nr:RidA family protein [Acidimicrobiia bacterium]
MSKTFSNPETVHRPNNDAYSHVVVVEGGKLLFVAGQVAFDEDSNIVGDDVYTQACQALRNLRAVLEAHGASPADIVKLNTYVVGDAHAHAAELGRARAEVLQLEVPPASTLVGIASLAVEGLLVEIEAIAVVD